jgi:hypothetical protein
LIYPLELERSTTSLAHAAVVAEGAFSHFKPALTAFSFKVIAVAVETRSAIECGAVWKV